MNSLIFPPYVHEGDRAIILSPSSKIDKSFLKGAKKRLKSWGLEVIIAKHAGSAHGTYAGSIQQRLKDLQEAMDDEKAKVILCSRGGYGAVHLVGQLDFTRFRQHPKWLIGFSDITALHNVFQQNGFASLHAPMARHLTVEPEDDFCCQALKDILFGNNCRKKPRSAIPARHTSSTAKARERASFGAETWRCFTGCAARLMTFRQKVRYSSSKT